MYCELSIFSDLIFYFMFYFFSIAFISIVTCDLKMILVFTGNGKGKTSASVGVIIRALGYNKKILFSQFLKAQKSGERDILEKLNVDVVTSGTKAFLNKDNFDENKRLAKDMMKKIEQMNQENHYDLIVLDELNIAVKSGLISVQEAVDFIKSFDCDVIVTGRYASEKILDIADLVTEMKEIKHPFQKGIPAKEGIDY